MVGLRHGLHAGGINPAVKEIEQTADHDGVINGFVGPAGLVEAVNVALLNRGTVAIDLLDVGEQGFFGVGDRRCLIVREYGIDFRTILEQFGRDRGVAFNSKRTMVKFGSKSGNQLAESGAERGGPAHDGLRKALEMLGRRRFEGEQVHDSGYAGPRRAYAPDKLAITTGTVRVVFDIG